MKDNNNAGLSVYCVDCHAIDKKYKHVALYILTPISLVDNSVFKVSLFTYNFYRFSTKE